MLSPLRPTRWRYVWQFLFDFWWTALIQLWGEVKLVAVHKTDRARSLLSKMAVRPDENAYLYYFSWALVTSQLSYFWKTNKRLLWRFSVSFTTLFSLQTKVLQSSDRFIGHIFRCLHALMVCVPLLPFCVSTEYLFCEYISLCVHIFK